MNREQVIDLLTAAVAYDNRNPGEANIAAWQEAATRAGWTFPEALEALHDHYATTTDYLMPAHITRRIKAARETDLPPRYVAQIEGPPPADETTRKRIMAMVGNRFSMPAKRERKPRPKSAEEKARRAQAEAELDRIRGEAS